jgi:hypothetical protein
MKISKAPGVSDMPPFFAKLNIYNMLPLSAFCGGLVGPIQGRNNYDAYGFMLDFLMDTSYYAWSFCYIPMDVLVLLIIWRIGFILAFHICTDNNWAFGFSTGFFWPWSFTAGFSWNGLDIILDLLK